MTQYQGKHTDVLADKNDLFIQTYQIIKGMHVYTSHPILIFGGLNLPYIFTRNTNRPSNTSKLEKFSNDHYIKLKI